MTVQLANGPTLGQVVAERIKRNLLQFVLFMKPTYQVALHHKAICEKLDAFARGEIKRLMIFVPPQHGKSELSSRFLPAFLLGRNPNLKVAICSFSDDLAASFNRDVQRIIDTEDYRKIFPRTLLNGYRPAWGGVLKGYERNSSIFEIVGKRGSLRVTSLPNGQLTGQPVDIGIIDDPFKNRLEAESEVTRKNVWDWYTDVFLSRLHGESQQLLLMTRWHEEDLAGKLLTQDEERKQQGLDPYWEVVSFPAIKETQPTELDPRQPGEALWPERHPKSSLMEKKEKGGDRTWNSLFQQTPTSRTGNIIKTEKFGYITQSAFAQLTQFTFVNWKFLIDGAYTNVQENDATALFAYYFHEETQTLYIKEVVSVRLEFEQVCDYIKKFVARNNYGPFSTIKIEPKASGLSVFQSLRDTTGLNVELFEFPVIMGTRMADKDKVVRALAVSPKIGSGRVVLIEESEGHPWHQTFKKQTGSFPLAKNDDEVDDLVMALLEEFFGDKPGTISSN